MDATYYAHGKILLSGEYFVLDGAQALALPTQLGQSMKIKPADPAGRRLRWICNDSEATTFNFLFFLPSMLLDGYDGTDWKKTAGFRDGVLKMIHAAQELNGRFLKTTEYISVYTRLEFPWGWGLGSSSTLVHLVSQWANIDPYQLLEKTFGGSGYDVACAAAEGPILYQTTPEKRVVAHVAFSPAFKDALYFVYLGKKQNSREGIRHYRSKGEQAAPVVAEITQLTDEFLRAGDLKTFERVIIEHEAIVGWVVELPRAKFLYFDDYWGEIKSLGAWGGDFVLATSDRSPEETQTYFRQKGFPFCLTYDELIL